jgi:hypothetical protein
MHRPTSKHKIYTFQIRVKTDNPVYTIGPTDALMVKCVYPMLFIKDMFRPLSRSASGQYIFLVYYPSFVVSVPCPINTIPPAMCVQKGSSSYWKFYSHYCLVMLEQLDVVSMLLATMVTVYIGIVWVPGFAHTIRFNGFSLFHITNVYYLCTQC